jgi:hypothetical protein
MAINTISTAARNAMCDALVDLIDGGAGAGTIQIRTASGGGGTLLATLTFSDPAFGAASSGVATASAITDDSSADATGTAGYCVILDSDSNSIFEGTVGTSGADINFNTVAFTSGDTVSISSMTITMPAS